MPDAALKLLHIAPAVRPSVLQPEYGCSRVWRLPVPADGELVETVLNPVIGRLFSGFDPGTCTWSIVGDADTVRQSAERTAIVKAIEEAGEPIGPRQVAEATGMKIANTRMLMSRMKKDGALKAARKFGKYELANRGPEQAQP